MEQTGRFRTLLAWGLSAVYVLLYLLATGDIGFGRYGFQWRVVSEPLSRMTEMRGAFHFEAVAMAELGRAVVFISPGNLLISAILGLLLAANIHGFLELRDRNDCRLPGKFGASAGAVPALLAGGACCAPGLLLLLGLPGLGAFIGLFAWLVPLSALLLLINRRHQRRQGAAPVLMYL